MNGLNKGFLRKVIKMMCQTPGLIDAVGGISDALKKLQAMIEANKK